MAGLHRLSRSDYVTMWFTPTDEKQQKAFEAARVKIKALLVVRKEGMTPSSLLKSLEEADSSINLNELRFSHFNELLFHCQDFVDVRVYPPGRGHSRKLFLFMRPNSVDRESLNIWTMIQKRTGDVDRAEEKWRKFTGDPLPILANLVYARPESLLEDIPGYSYQEYGAQPGGGDGGGNGSGSAGPAAQMKTRGDATVNRPAKSKPMMNVRKNGSAKAAGAATVKTTKGYTWGQGLGPCEEAPEQIQPEEATSMHTGLEAGLASANGDSATPSGLEMEADHDPETPILPADGKTAEDGIVSMKDLEVLNYISRTKILVRTAAPELRQQLTLFEEKMAEYYNQAGKTVAIPKERLVQFGYYAALFDNRSYRVQVDLREIDGEYVKALRIDHGDTYMIKFQNLSYLKTSFVREMDRQAFNINLTAGPKDPIGTPMAQRLLMAATILKRFTFKIGPGFDLTEDMVPTMKGQFMVSDAEQGQVPLQVGFL